MGNRSTPRRIAAAAAVVIVVPAFASCSADVAPPAQNIGGNKVQKSERPVPQPRRTTGNRLSFGDEFGTGHVKPRKPLPAGSGTRNRMQFPDDDW